MSNLRYGVIGCAGFGPTHADALGVTDGADLVACADVDESAAEEFAAGYGCTAFTDVTELVTEADVDAVSVCAPSGTHADAT